MDLIEILECPKCRRDLVSEKDALKCPHCNESSNKISQINWLFRFPESTLVQWQARARKLLQNLENQVQKVEQDLKRPQIIDKTEERLNRIKAGLITNAKTISDILSPLLSLQGNQLPLIQALTEKVPYEQTVESYFPNIFRDWVWGDNENKLTVDLVMKALGKVKPEAAMVLGSGAGRLTWDLAQTTNIKLLVAVDINPLLMLLFKHINEGKSFNLSEIPLSPISLKNVCIEHQIKAPKKVSLEYLFADACNLPVRPKCMDAIFTPWFIDIVKQDLKDLSRRINRTLKVGGHWLNFGPLGFHHTSLTENYTWDEVEKIISENGFKINFSEERSVPYLQSPHSGQWRQEKIICFRAEKVKDTKEPSFFSTLPDWIQDPSLPIPTPIQSSLEMSRYQLAFQIISALNGKNSLNDIAAMISQHYQIPKDKAQEIVIGFLVERFEN